MVGMFRDIPLEDIVVVSEMLGGFFKEHWFRGYSHMTDECFTIVCDDLVLNIEDVECWRSVWEVGE